jgi:hypothetical protein
VRAVDGFYRLPKAARLDSFQPHMHMRGKAMGVTAIYPNGKTETLSYVDNFQFNWHLSYIYADDVAPLLPAGTILHVRSWIDNTAANRANPDPTQWVGYGQRSIDEMTHAWVNIVYLDDEDFKQLEVERKTKQAPTLTAQF